jgi:hypothetical protein
MLSVEPALELTMSPFFPKAFSIPSTMPRPEF